MFAVLSTENGNEVKKTRGTIRDRLDRFINSVPTNLVVGVLIIASVTLLLFELSLSNRETALAFKLMRLNDVITGIFIIELSIRFYVEKKKSRFFRRFWIDIIAVIPIFRGLRFLRILSLLRLFRLGIILTRQLRGARSQLVKIEYVVLAVACAIAVLMGGISMRFAEGGQNTEVSTLEQSFWFATMTMVAGEPIGTNPTTPVGRVITLVLMLGGLTVFAIFTGTVSAVMVDALSRMKVRSMDLDELHDHTVVCGWNRSGELILSELLHDSHCRNIVVVSEVLGLEQTAFFQKYPQELFVVEGDFTRMNVLKEANIENAQNAILLADSSKEERSAQDRDARTVLAAMLIEKLNPKIHTTVQLLNRDNETSLRKAGVEEIIVTDEYVGSIIGSVVRNRGISNVLSELLTAKYGHQFYKLKAPKSLVGKTVQEAMVILKEKHDATLLAVERGTKMDVNPKGTSMIEEGNSIVIAATDLSTLL